MDVITALLSGFGLAASAGLNAYIPLLLVAISARLFPNLVVVADPFKFIVEPWFIAVVAVLLVIEVFADKVPAVDHVNDILGTVIRPAAGALLFATMTGTVQSLDPRVAAVAGLIVAGTAHGAKATARPIVTATTGGLGNPVVSTAEDVAALVTSVVALIAPLLIGLAAVLFGVLFLVWYIHRSSRAAATPPGGASAG
jgi:hypothetical protein